MDFLENQDVEVMEWPPKSPDVNPIEHLLDQMAVNIHDMDNPPTTAAQLRVAVQQAWVALRVVKLWTRPWYGACHVACELSPFVWWSHLLSTNRLRCHWTKYENVSCFRYGHYSLIQVAETPPDNIAHLPASTRKLLTLALLLQN